jgi:hypothetical protein
MYERENKRDFGRVLGEFRGRANYPYIFPVNTPRLLNVFGGESLHQSFVETDDNEILFHALCFGLFFKSISELLGPFTELVQFATDSS